MRRTFGLALGVVALAGAMLACTGCGGGAGGEKRINAGGSTFVYPMMDKWAAEYDKAKGVKVNYNSIGSGGGIRQMIDQTFDFGCTDAPMTPDQMGEAKKKNGEVVHIPLVMGAVVPAYNLSGVEKPLVFSGPILADIFLGKIKTWNDEALKKLNPDVELPDKGIAVCHRADGSGTTHIWVDYLSKVSPEWKKKVGVGTSVQWPTGSGGKGNEGVTAFVKQTDGSIGYVELIYALGNNVKFGAVVNKEGNPITADLKSVTAAAAGALSEIPEDLRYSITNAPGKDAYPISGTVWAVAYVKQPAAKKQLIVDYLTWCTHDGQQFCEALHYAKLPAGLVERLEKKLKTIQTK